MTSAFGGQTSPGFKRSFMGKVGLYQALPRLALGSPLLVDGHHRRLCLGR